MWTGRGRTAESRRSGLRRFRWTRRIAAAVALSVVPLALPSMAAPASAGLLGSTSRYIVSDLNGTDSSLAASVVASVGGQVASLLDVADGVAADLSPLQVSLLSLVPGVIVTPDVAVAVQGTGTPDPSHAPSAVFPQQTQAPQLWAQGDTGAGVNVAVLDTGIDPLPDFAGRLVPGVDLSGEGNPLHDSYGHGTFVAGLVAGNGASSNGAYTGEAPGAGLVAVKVAGASGQTDLATVIAGVGWTISHKAAFGIGVLNMSLGFAPFTSTALNPLDMAVEKAWQSGIVVVTSAGNAGPFNGTILSPGDDPLVLTVGALDDMAQPSTAADTGTPFSSVGPTNPDGWFKPDLATSGRSVISLRAPGSTIDQGHPSARIGTGNFVGSGTSFSAAITSGAVALVLAAHPSDQPNDVKAAVLASTDPGPVGNPFVDGHGALDIAAAAAVANVGLDQSSGSWGIGPALGATVSLAQTWDSSTWNGTAWNGTAWNGTAWNGTAWNGTAWNGTAWNGTAWNGSQWG
jgi:serine protease AprX